MSSHFGGGLPLDEFNKNTPPGWKPGIEGYPLKHYLDLCSLWYKQHDGKDEEVGILLSGRLKGAAKQDAIKLT